MSGYKYKLIIEFTTPSEFNYTIHKVVNSFDLFLKKYLKDMDVNVFSSRLDDLENRFQLILFDEEYPIMSFFIYYEFF